ncbi:TPA: hypothetical protein ACQJO4_002456 [Vibrio parahaemolyticus]
MAYIQNTQELQALVADLADKVANGKMSMINAVRTINQNTSTLNYLSEEAVAALRSLKEATRKNVFAEQAKAFDAACNAESLPAQTEEAPEAQTEEVIEEAPMMESEVVEVSAEELAAHLLQRQREENAKKYAQKKARDRQQALANAGLIGELDAVQKEVMTSVDKAVEGFEKFLSMEHTKTSKVAKFLPLFTAMSQEDRATLISDSLDVMLNSIDVVNVSGIIHRLGDLVELSVNFIKQREKDKKMTQRLEQVLEKQNNASSRAKTIKYSLKVNSQTWKEWDIAVKVSLGQILFHCILEYTDLFETEQKETTSPSFF